MIVQALAKKEIVMDQTYQLSRYRWVVLSVFMLLNLASQVLWVVYAPITSVAAATFGVTEVQIGLLAMIFMIAFIPLSIPAAWVIDTVGLRVAVNIAAVLIGVFGLARAFAGYNYTFVLISTIGIACAQPFLFNSWTKLPARWFGLEERATAVGLITLSNLIGTTLSMLLTPILVKSLSLQQVQFIYGGLAFASMLLFLIFAREKPMTPPCPEGYDSRALMLDGLKHVLKVKEFWFYAFTSFVGVGIYTGITTWVEGIIKPRGFSSTQAGLLGAFMLVGGMLGSLLIPPVSDRIRKRKVFLIVGFILSIPGLIGIAFATLPWLLYFSAFVFGFFMISTGPVGMQYLAEITYPTPEGTSNGLIQLLGQASVVFVYAMAAIKAVTGTFTSGLLISAGLMGVSILLISLAKDSSILFKDEIKTKQLK